VLDLYLHRGSFETVLVDEDDEQESDRWYSHTPCGQEFAQILAQWVWNLRLELGRRSLPLSYARPNLLLPMSSMLFLYVDDVDAWYKRAVAGGATPMEEPKDQFYGDRVGAITDPFGNTWYMATHIKDANA